MWASGPYYSHDYQYNKLNSMHIEMKIAAFCKYLPTVNYPVVYRVISI